MRITETVDTEVRLHPVHEEEMPTTSLHGSPMQLQWEIPTPTVLDHLNSSCSMLHLYKLSFFTEDVFGQKHTYILGDQQYLRFPALILNQTQVFLQ